MRKIKINSIYIFVLVNIISFRSFSQYGWPLTPSNTQHNITGTIGEYRSGSNPPGTQHFHQGTDMINQGDKDVFAIEGGVISWNGLGGTLSIITIEGLHTFRYIHTIKSLTLNLSLPITAGMKIGEMATGTDWPMHLHLEEPGFNILAGRISPYIDNSPPRTITNYGLFKNGLLLNHPNNSTIELTDLVQLNGISYKKVYNKIDIMANVTEPGVSSIGNNDNANRHLAPYQISYQIFNDLNDSLDYKVNNLTFDYSPTTNMINYVFSKGTTSGSPNFILTNNPFNAVRDRYWNTGLRTAVIETWPNNTSLDARFPEEAKYPEGKKIIRVIARDIDIDNTFNESDPPLDINVLIDNFKPYVKKVVVKEFPSGANMSTLYSSEWKLDATGLSPVLRLDPQISGSRYLSEYIRNPGNSLKIEITFSEPMRSYATSDMSVDIFSECAGHHKTASAIFLNESNDHKIFTFIIDDANLIPHSEFQDIEITAQDLAGNQLMGFNEANTGLNIDEVAIRDINGNWVNDNYFGNTDKVHHFKIRGCFSNYRIGDPRPPDAPMSTDCMIADFSADLLDIQVGGSVHFTNRSTMPDLSDPAWIWNFGDNTIEDDAKDPSHIFSTPGNFTITLKATDLSSGEMVEKTITNFIHVGGNTGSGTTTLSIEASDLSIEQGNSVVFSPNFINPPTSVEYFWSFPDGNPSSSSDPFPEIYYDVPGSHDVSLFVIDDNNVLIYAPTISIRVDEFIWPLEVQCSQPFLQPRAGVSQYLSVNIWGGQEPYSIRWNFNDGSPEVITNSYYTDHIFTESGVNYTIDVTVVDARGARGNCTYNITTVGSNGMVMDFSADITSSPNHPASIVFTPTITGGNFQRLIFDWSFGDGTFGSVIQTDIHAFPSITHIYSEPSSSSSGKYTVQVTITDILGVKNHFIKQDYIAIGSEIIPLNPGVVLYKNTFCDDFSPHPIASADAMGGVQRPTPSYDPISEVDYYYFFAWVANTPGYNQNSNSGNSFLSHTTNQSTYIIKENLIPQPTYPYTFDLMCQVSDYATPHNIFQIHQSVTLYDEIKIQQNDISLCPGGSIVLQPVITGGTGKFDYKYRWSASIGNLSCITCPNPIYTFPANASGLADITLSVDDSRDVCASKVKIFHVHGESISVTIPDVNLCRDSQKQLSPSITGGSGVYTYTWSPSTYLDCNHCLSPIIKPLQNGTFIYTIKINDPSGCDASAQVYVNVSSDHPDIGPIADAFTCPGKEVTLTGNATGGSGNYIYQWYETYNTSNITTSNTLTVGPFQTTGYTFFVTDLNGCSSTSEAFIYVDREKAPIANAGLDRIACANMTDLFATANGGIPPYLYQWNYGAGNISIINPLNVSNPSSTATYNVVVTDNNGCKGKDEITISHRETFGTYISGWTPQFVCLGNSLPLYNNTPIVLNYNPYGNSYDPPFTYKWTPSTYLNDPAIENPICTPVNLEPLTYCVQITDSKGCDLGKGASWINPFKQDKDPELIFYSDEGCIVDEFCFDVIPNIELKSGIVTDEYSPAFRWECDGMLQYMHYDADPTEEISFSPQPEMVTRLKNHYCVRYSSVGLKHITYNYLGSTPLTYYICSAFSKTYDILIKHHDETDGIDIVKGYFSGNGTVNHTSIEIWAPWKPLSCPATTYSCYSCIIDSPKILSLIAKDQIVLYPGFEIYEGAELIAQIDPCLVNNNSFSITSGTITEPIYSSIIEMKVKRNEETKQTNDFEIFPNPTFDIINIIINMNNEYKKELVLTNHLGEMVKIFILGEIKEMNFQFDLKSLNINQGIYFLTLKANDYIKSKKIAYVN